MWLPKNTLEIRIDGFYYRSDVEFTPPVDTKPVADLATGY
jgi:hypothetical protein